MPDIIAFEHPLSERMRLMLRLEHLFESLEQFRSVADPWASRLLVYGLLDIRDFVGRADVKSELAKEIERHNATLSAMREQPQVDQNRLEDILHELERVLGAVQNSQTEGKKLFRDDELLCAVEQRYSVPGGACSFDLPAFHQWLQGDAAIRRAALERWLAAIQPLRQAVRISLRLTRASSQPETRVAEGGCYQQTIPANRPLHLIRIGISADEQVYPEISGNTHRFSIRFTSTQDDSTAQPRTDDLPFSLTSCQF